MPDKSYKAELVGVFGCPVAENPTVVMQEAAFAAKGLQFRYLTIEVRPEDLPAAINGLRAMNFRGINLTIPHKVAVIAHLDEIADDAKLIGAVNTVTNVNGKLVGTNTDGKGFLQSLREEAKTDPTGKRFVLLGAGGAARAVSVELALAGAAHITIVNRSERRGRELVELLNEKTSVSADFCHWNKMFEVPAGTDVLVNATSIGLYPDLDGIPDIFLDSIQRGMVVCDVIPNPPRTRLLREAQKRGAATIDGLGMLVNQGAIGFACWTGEQAPVDAMKRALREEFGV